MKTTILIKDKRKQLVLEPENEIDRQAVKLFGEAKVELYEKHLGSFYDCQGGWTRQNANKNESLIIVFKDEDLTMHFSETIAGIDFGFTNPTAVLTIKRDYDNNFWVTDEWYKRNKTDEGE